MPAANATSLIPTELSITVSPHSVTYPIGQLAVSGTLDALVNGGRTLSPIAGETVTVSLATDGGNKVSPLGSFVTDANGQFSTTATALSPGEIRGQFAGDATYHQAAGGGNFVAQSQLPTRVTVEKITAVPYRSTATVTAQVTMELADGTWVPAPGSLIHVENCTSSPGSGWTDSNGDWTTTIPAVPPGSGDPQCDFFTDGLESASWTQWTTSPGFVVPLTTFPTEIFGFSPVPGNKTLQLGDIQFYGLAWWLDSAGNPHPDSGATVRLYLRYAGTSKPQLMATAVVGKSGAFTFPRLSGYLSHGRLAAGAWQARLPARGRYVAGDSGYYHGVLALPASFRSVKITGTGSTRHLTGTLDLPKGHPLHGVRVTLLSDVNGTLKHGTTVTTNAKGYFSIAVTAPKHPSQVKYAASFAGLAGKVPAWIGPVGYVSVNKAVSNWLRW
jgi:hypothetical protein